jgi:hypothetical protein
MEFGDKWIEDSESEEDEDYVQNEVPPPQVDEDFRNKVLNVKHSLYDNIVLSPNLDSKDAQSKQVLNEYLSKLNKVYVLALNAKSGRFMVSELNSFPEPTRVLIKDTMDWIKDFFSKNRVPDTIPYDDYINKSFHEYQFVQDNSFE